MLYSEQNLPAEETIICLCTGHSAGTPDISGNRNLLEGQDMNRHLLSVIFFVLLAAGCGKTENNPKSLPQPSLMQPGDAIPSSAPTPPLPDPVAAKAADADLPKPGQAGDHSSPVFKSGGKTDTTK